MKHFKTLSSYLEYLLLPPPEHPQFSVFTAFGAGHLPCPRESSPPITNDCYTISFKKIVSGELTYGRTQYDFTNGALFFLSPRQVLQWEKQAVIEQKGFSIHFHEDFLQGTDLPARIRDYGFFSYSVNEALHLSPREEEQLQRLVGNIELEYQNNPDAFSKDIIVSLLDTLLKYAQRFYERQFIHRQAFSTDLLERYNRQILEALENGSLRSKGIPSIQELANRLSVSQRYLSDTLKKETGKTATEHLHLFLINQAKDQLLEPGKTIAEVAYELGFEYPPYFSRLFKRKEGITPSEFRERYRLN